MRAECKVEESIDQSATPVIVETPRNIIVSSLARAEHDFGGAGLYRREELGDISGVVLEVGVLHHEVVAERGREAVLKRGALTAVLGSRKHFDVRMFQLYLSKSLFGCNIATIVDNNHFAFPATERGVENALDYLADSSGLVITGNDY